MKIFDHLDILIAFRAKRENKSSRGITLSIHQTGLSFLAGASECRVRMTN